MEYDQYWAQYNRGKSRTLFKFWTPKDTPHLALAGELWGVFGELFGEEKWPRNIPSALYLFFLGECEGACCVICHDYFRDEGNPERTHVHSSYLGPILDTLDLKHRTGIASLSVLSLIRSLSVTSHNLHQGLSIHKVYGRKISRSLEGARFGFKLFQSHWNLTCTSLVALPRCLSNFRAMRSL